MGRSILAGTGFLAAVAAAAVTLGEDVPPELTAPNYRSREIGGIGYEPGVERQDPSNVIRVGDRYFAWYTRRKAGVHPYASTVFYATSTDGLHWTEHGEAIGKGGSGAWDSFGVITPYAANLGGKCYLFYTGTSAERPFRSRGPDGTLRHVGVAEADDPRGPWRKFDGNPVLSPDSDAWDSLIWCQTVSGRGPNHSPPKS